MTDKKSSAPMVAKERIYTASQWQLTWWRFSKSKVAVISAVILILFYLSGAFCEFLAPHTTDRYNPEFVWAPPQRIHFIDENGKFSRPFVYGFKSTRDPDNFALVFEEDKNQKYPLHLLVRGDSFKWWGLWKTDLHLFGITSPEGDQNPMLYIWGADAIGRDLFSRTVYGGRISLSIGVIGVCLSLFLGILFGGISGLYGGVVDTLIQRLIELLRSLPGIPLWLTLAASVPRSWSTTQVYFAITIILSLLSWTGVAREVRGKFLSLRGEDFVLAAKLSGASDMRIIMRHMVPSFTSHLIASLTLTIPDMILAETALSFLGLGLQAPAVSWGVLLQSAQNVRAIALSPWLLLPGLLIIIVVLAFNYVGDGLRDAADPYAQ
ncbi:MAG: ABC transporter permease [Armatimonadota bacterium]